MYRGLSRKRRFGFTLVEVLVTTVVVGVMAAVVIPAMVKQTTAADSPRVASDLGSIKAAIETFSLNVRPRMPGDIEDLTNAISTTQVDLGLDGVAYSATNVTKWKGPYLEWAVASTASDANTVVVFKSGGSASVSSALYRCPSASTVNSYAAVGSDLPCTIYTDVTGNTLTDRYAAVRVTGIAVGSTEFTNLNDVIDGTSETDPKDSGLLRQNASGTVYFLAVPYTAP